MEILKPESVENPSKLAKTEIEKSEVRIRVLERSEKELTMKDLIPNTTYEKNGYTYQTDSHACPVRVSGYLRLEKGERTPQQTEIGRMGKLGDEGGHIIGAQFDGPTDAFNIRPQDKIFNHEAYTKLETTWKEALEAGKKVKVDIKLQYGDNGIRPDRYNITYSIDDGITTLELKNQAKQS